MINIDEAFKAFIKFFNSFKEKGGTIKEFLEEYGINLDSGTDQEEPPP